MSNAINNKLHIQDLAKMREAGQRITMVALYDYLFAKIAEVKYYAFRIKYYVLYRK